MSTDFKLLKKKIAFLENFKEKDIIKFWDNGNYLFLEFSFEDMFIIKTVSKYWELKEPTFTLKQLIDCDIEKVTNENEISDFFADLTNTYLKLGTDYTFLSNILDSMKKLP